MHRRLLFSLISLMTLLPRGYGEETDCFNQSSLHPAWAGKTISQFSRLKSTDNAGIICRVARLTSKGTTYVVAGERRFTLMPDARLQDAQKKPLALEEITFPCHALLCYQLTPNRREASLVSLSIQPEW